MDKSRTRQEGKGNYFPGQAEVKEYIDWIRCRPSAYALDCRCAAQPASVLRSRGECICEQGEKE